MNENINNSFFYAAQTSAQPLSKGQFEFGILLGGGILRSSEINSPTDSAFPAEGRIFTSGLTPTIFGDDIDTDLFFQFEDPISGQALINPITGENVEFRIPLPPGLGLDFGAAPSAALSLAYGIGFGTELKGYVTPGLLSFADLDEESITFDNDLAWGIQAKHDLARWLPFLRNNNVFFAISGGFSSYELDMGTSFFEAPITEEFRPGQSMTITDNLAGASYSLETYGGRLMIGKRFGFIEINLSGDYTVNSYEMMSEGGFSVRINDQINPTNSTEIDLVNAFDFSGENTEWGYGGGISLGSGWLRFDLNYRRANINFGSVGIRFVFGAKKDRVPQKETNNQ